MRTITTEELYSKGWWAGMRPKGSGIEHYLHPSILDRAKKLKEAYTIKEIIITDKFIHCPTKIELNKNGVNVEL